MLLFILKSNKISVLWAPSLFFSRIVSGLSSSENISFLRINFWKRFVIGLHRAICRLKPLSVSSKSWSSWVNLLTPYRTSIETIQAWFKWICLWPSKGVWNHTTIHLLLTWFGAKDWIQVKSWWPVGFASLTIIFKFWWFSHAKSLLIPLWDGLVICIVRWTRWIYCRLYSRFPYM